MLPIPTLQVSPQVTAVPAALIAQGATGYQATISMAAKTTHVSNVGNLVSDLYTNGALVVAQPVLSVENENSLSQQAFNSALSDAKSQASQIGNTNLEVYSKDNFNFSSKLADNFYVHHKRGYFNFGK